MVKFLDETQFEKDNINKVQVTFTQRVAAVTTLRWCLALNTGFVARTWPKFGDIKLLQDMNID